ncbi:HNH endonuclease signature motif containing protein [Microtetraspora malaysiensis]|uniref:DUF222 domain-containing protein n=1 Tax=Microtetraspora malaysiensis TaxID=161358 RepID=A0ABW6T1R7_9ACTN
MAPGVELAAVLAEIDIARLDGYDAVTVMQAYARLEAHVQARKAVVMAEVGLYEISASGMAKMSEPDNNSPDEIRAALRLTRRAAEREYGIAYDLKVRLPAVRDALSAGLIDKARAVVFCDWLEDVPVELARAVAAHLLPKAGKWTTSELREKIKKLLIAADPAWARRKYERAVQQRRVIGVRHADGSASIMGQQLPVDQAAAAIARVDAIAVRAKRSGLPAPIDHVRADVFLGLLDGSMSGLDDDAIIAVLFEEAARKAAGDEDDHDDQLSDNPFGTVDLDDTGDAEAAAEDATALHTGSGDPDGAPGDIDGDASQARTADPTDNDDDLGDTGPDPGPTPGAGPGSAPSSGDGGPVGPASGTGAEGGSSGPGAGPTRTTAVGTNVEGGRAGPVGFAAGELRVQVSTLMHLGDLPGELAGWGPIHAQLARRLAKRQISGEWRFAVCDEEGRLLYAGITRRRPRGWARPAGWPRRPVPGPAPGPGLPPGLGLPPALSSPPGDGDGTDPAGAAGTGVTPARTSAAGQEKDDRPSDDRPSRDLRARSGSLRRRGIVELQLPLPLLRALCADIYAQGGWAGVIADIMRQYDEAVDEAADHARGSVTGRRIAAGDERRRFPKAGLRRRIEVRDRVCSHPGCRTPATRSEMDHTRQHANGGPTTDSNLAAACAHDHDLRDNGWQVVQTSSGHLTWISRTGHSYPVQPPPIIEPMPEPFAPNSWPQTETDLHEVDEVPAPAPTAGAESVGSDPPPDPAHDMPP